MSDSDLSSNSLLDDAQGLICGIVGWLNRQVITDPGARAVHAGLRQWLVTYADRASNEPPPEQEPRSFSPWRVPDPPRVNVAEALRPFVELFEKSNERYRQRGGDLGQFRDTHPFREITAKELPLGVWRRAQAVLRASQPQFACPVCNQMLPSRDVVHDCPAPPPADPLAVSHLRGLVYHWNEFGPAMCLEEKMHYAHEWLKRHDESTPLTKSEQWIEPAKHCQNGGDVCLAGNKDGICCPDDSCDIDDGMTSRDPRCDCENPEPASGAALVSMECPVHNEKPTGETSNARSPFHGATMKVEKWPDIPKVKTKERERTNLEIDDDHDLDAWHSDR